MYAYVRSAAQPYCIVFHKKFRGGINEHYPEKSFGGG